MNNWIWVRLIGFMSRSSSAGIGVNNAIGAVQPARTSIHKHRWKYRYRHLSSKPDNIICRTGSDNNIRSCQPFLLLCMSHNHYRHLDPANRHYGGIIICRFGANNTPSAASLAMTGIYKRCRKHQYQPFFPERSLSSAMSATIIPRARYPRWLLSFI